MYRQTNGHHPSRGWMLVPLLVAAGLVATFVGLWLYAGASALPPPSGSSYPFFWFPFGWWFVFIPVFFVIFFAVRWYLWGGWWWGRYYDGYDLALETLRQRYAKGEIAQEEYERTRAELER